MLESQANKGVSFRKVNVDAFTLVELLVVMAIIATLSAIILPIIGIGQSAADQAATSAVAVKVERALGLAAAQLRAEITTCWRETDDPKNWGNHLYYRLSTTKSEADLIAFKSDLDARKANIGTTYTIANLDIDAYQGPISAGTWATDRTKYYNGVISELKKREGYLYKAEKYTVEFLSPNDIGQDFIQDHTDDRGMTFKGVTDAYGSLLIHLHKNDPGVPVQRYGNNSALAYVKMLAVGRTAVVDLNANGPEDELALSDARSTCYAGYEFAHEIWSAGPDGLFDPIRGNYLENDDNFTHAADKYRGQ